MKAIHTLDRPLATTAGPGAGKTRVLVKRYLHILSQPNVDVENIVAITFTTKAANEMRERIRREIDENIVRTRRTAAETFWRERKRRLDSGVIATIHGFCSRLLREYPIEANVDPRFSTLDDYTATLLLDAAAEQAVTGMIDAGDDGGAHLVAAYGRANLVEALKRLYVQLRGLGVSLAEAQATTERNTLTESDYHERFAGAQARAAEIFAAKVTTENARAQVAAFQEAWTRRRAELAVAPHSKRALEFLDALETIRTATPSAQTKALKESVHALRKILGDRETSGSLAAAFFDVCAGEYQPILFKTLNAADFLYASAKRSAQALDYEDLQLAARDVLKREDVRRRVGARYRYFLVDEFQDTNQLQRDIINALTLDSGSRSAEAGSLFLVGDRKQSIYNFRGAEVEVFERAIADITERGGELVRLDVNFRSDPRLVDFFNAFFAKVMRLESGDEPTLMQSAGFVEHEDGVAHRAPLSDEPAVEFLRSAKPEAAEGGNAGDDEDSLRDIEARRLATRIRVMVRERELRVRNASGDGLRPAEYRDFAMLFGAFTHVKTYEEALRRANVPYYVVAGRGFYSRPEVLDILTLLEFLDNRTDEISLAGALRSPLFGVSDETLFALRFPPNDNGEYDGSPQPLFASALASDGIADIAAGQRALLADAVRTLQDLIAVRNRLPLSHLIERAIRLTQYDVVCAGAEDGPQRLSNLDKLIVQARAFEKRETRLLRDFVEYIREFRRLEAREAEAQLEMGLDAVAILTIHKSKGLEFPIVALPDLQHEKPRRRSEFSFERSLGVGFDVPDRRGGRGVSALQEAIDARLDLRESFESMRRLYVGMTRAQDFLILSAAAKTLKKNEKSLREQSNWLQWIFAALDAPEIGGDETTTCGAAKVRVLGPDAELETPRGDDPPPLEANVEKPAFVARASRDARERQQRLKDLIARIERQMAPAPPAENAPGVHYRYSVTQLANYGNCPRQYYFARFLQAPDIEFQPRRTPDDAERREGRARLSPNVRGTVIHRFCETHREGADARAVLREAFQHVRESGGYDEDEFVRVNEDDVFFDLWPLARNYLASALRQEIEARWRAGAAQVGPDGEHPFVKSEMGFMLRTDAATILGSIDKVLLTPERDGMHAHVIDFKTNTLWKSQAGYDAELAEKAATYRIQMQSYALAAWRLLPNVTRVSATLHFLHPNLEYRFPPEQTTEEAALRAVSAVALKIRGVRFFQEANFEANPGARCLSCRFNDVCADALRVESLPDA